MFPIRHSAVLSIALLACGLSACQQNDTEAAVESIRPIKSLTLGTKAQAVEERKFSGLVRAANSSTLSFEVSGKILEITADIGDQITAGQHLATINDEPFKLLLQSAEADLKKARANYKNTDSDYQRKSELRKKGYVSASDLDQALAERDAARNQVTMVQSQLNIVKRDLRNTVLKAPFSGYISKRLAEPHQEISSGQELFLLSKLDEMEVELMLPENIISQVKLGDAGKAFFPGQKNTHATGHINEIGTQAEAANAFPVILGLTERPQGIFPGMTAEVQLSIDHGDQADGFLLPATAVVAGVGTGSGRHFIFVYQPQTGTVHKTPVLITGGQQKMARVSKGLQTGDIVAIAGASFLSDGMTVRLLKDKQR